MTRQRRDVDRGATPDREDVDALGYSRPRRTRRRAVDVHRATDVDALGWSQSDGASESCGPDGVQCSDAELLH